MDEQALERARARIAEAREGRFETTRLEAALDRARTQIEALATATAELEGQLPERVGDAVREGLRREVLPVARTFAEIKGLINQANHRLERLEQELLAERHARVDDLAVLVDLVSSGWQGVDERLRRLEERAPRHESPAEVVTLPQPRAGRHRHRLVAPSRPGELRRVRAQAARTLRRRARAARVTHVPAPGVLVISTVPPLRVTIP